MKNYLMVDPEAESLQGTIVILDHLTVLDSTKKATDKELDDAHKKLEEILDGNQN